MAPLKRRATDHKKNGSLYQCKVDQNVVSNRELTSNQRMENLEHDIVLNTNVLYEIEAQNDKYSEYLDLAIQRERDAAIFWKDVKKRVATAGILGAIGLAGTVIVFAVKAYMKAL